MVVLAADLCGLLLPTLVVPNGRLPVAVSAILTTVAFQGAGLYRPRLRLLILEDLPALASLALVAALLVMAGVSVLHLAPGPGSFLGFAAAAATCAAATRGLAYRMVRSARAGGRVAHKTLLVGAGAVGQQLAHALEMDRSYGLRLVGLVDDDPLADTGLSAPYLGPLSRLPALVEEHRVDIVLVAFGRHSEPSVVDVLRQSERSGCDVFVVPRLFEVHSQCGQSDHIDGVPVTRLRRPRRVGPARHLKRAFDLVVSATALLVLTPILGVIVVAVRREVGPGVLFRQVRVGIDGTEFELLKFRSLRAVGDVESATTWSIAHDDRIGPVGRFLRRSSLDELPQLLNVLHGDMSLVGPRPERPHFVNIYSTEFNHYGYRHRVPCGLTGLAQVEGLRGDTSIRDRARFDNFYIENWTFYLDVKIIAWTFREVLAGAGR